MIKTSKTLLRGEPERFLIKKEERMQENYSYTLPPVASI